jgi:hypothetical protein
MGKEVVKRVIFDEGAGFVTIYFGDPETESYCSEIPGEDAVIIKDENGNPIGFQFYNLKTKI